MYNRFGATTQSVVDRFASGSYPAPVPLDDFGGDAAVGTFLDSAVSMLEQAITPECFRSFTDPALEQVVTRGTPGQTTCQLGLRPIVAGSVSLWQGPPSSFQLRPRQRWEIGTSYGDSGQYQGAAQYDNDRFKSGNFRLTEMDASLFSVDPTTGNVTLVNALNQDEQVYATYRTDVNNAAFSLPSLAQVAVDGAAAMIGAKAYTREQGQWKFVEELQEGFVAAIEAFAKGARIPSELRLMRWWQREVEKTQDQTISSLLRFRS